MSCGPPRRGNDEGVALALASLVGAILMLLAAVIVLRGVTETNQVVGDRRFEQALFVAEGAADVGLDTLASNSSWDTGHTASQLTTYAAVVAAADAMPSGQVMQTPEGEAAVLKPSDDAKVYGVAFMPSRAATSRIVRVVELEYQPTAGAGWAPDAAILGNGDVKIEEDAVTVTNPSSQHQAHIHANGDLELEGGCSIDGNATASGSVDDSGACSVYGTTAGGQAAVAFPDSSASSAWQSQLITEAQAGGTVAGIDISGSQEIVLTAPVYVNGHIKIKDDAKVTINGPGTVYVNGKIDVKDDAILTNGGLLASKDKIELKDDAAYIAVGDINQIALVSFSNSNEAIKIKDDVGGNLNGIAYAANGGIEIEDDAEWQGALLAGGPGNKGRVKVDDDVRIVFPTGLITDNQVLAGSSVEIASKRELQPS